MNPKEFKSKYGHTLHTDSQTGKHYIELPIADLSELAYMQESLLCGISMLTQLEHTSTALSTGFKYKKEQILSTIYWLSRLAQNSYPHEEINGLNEWLQEV